ncbi:hypothetical protein BUALT_Bualt07G0100800 [Buddleja alternifolia]|uniref:non-specific serine/threonine protein kinase n=1 Tax=Buddleja alternifolia TaxID=168488 RepID=A0AAV6X9Q7_9LAMI|nr:hypothetical protein BUALT_Bualt07G0100800 [Buddleja alternifolia]
MNHRITGYISRINSSTLATIDLINTLMEITSYYIFALAALMLLNFQRPFPATSLTTQATDQSALFTLRSHITLDPDRVITRNWTNSSSIYSWIGVTCNSRHHRVAELDISDMGLLSQSSILVMEKTSYYIFPLAALLLNFQMPFPATSLTTQATDQSALLALRSHITLDPYRVTTRNWTNSSSVCSWIGVTCNSRHHRVAALNISGMDLVGTVPPELGNLSFLVSLDLRYNFFTGNFPEELSFLHRLKFIDLKVNNFNGEVPMWFGFLPKLQVLSLRNNSFSGFIPHSISNLSNLKELDFSFNSLRGNIPDELGRLKRLEVLRLKFNQFSGFIPSTLFNLSSLKTLDLTSNSLSGILPGDMCRYLPCLEKIALSMNLFSGQIPSNLSECSQLQILSLSNNSFSGHIPGDIGKLTSLQILYLGENNLNGVIPQQIGDLQNLVKLALSNNRITGSVPLSVFNISSLQRLNLWSNKLTGSLPREIGNLTSLTYLSLMENNLTGLLPREIGKLYQLEVLLLGFNSFTGSVPSDFFNISTLLCLSFAMNDLSGSLPTNLGHRLPVLEELYLGQNHLSGSIPESISNYSKLRILSLAENNFTGFVPHFLGDLRLLESLDLFGNNLRTESSSSSELSLFTSLTNCRFLTTLDVGENPLDGIIPEEIGNLSTSLLKLDATNCKIKGNIPEEIGNLSNLMILFLDNNELTGKIPFTVKHLQKLQGLYLYSNKMEGSIPDALCNLHSLVNIYLSLNQFSGSIPECLGNVTSLRSLFLDSNLLSSSIPSSFWQIKDLLHLNLSTNLLSGFLPPEIGNLVTAILIDLSMNNLSKDIPSAIGNLQVLADLSLAHNSLEGSIPPSVGRMITLAALDLSYNNLSGSIPKSLERLQNLNYFNVSFNGLRGEIPSVEPFRNFTAESFKGNAALCGNPRFHVSSCSMISKHRSKKKRLSRALLVLSAVISLIVMIISLAFILTRYRRKDKLANDNGVLEPNVPKRISYYELLRATEQFSESNLLGMGGFGSVYKGIMRDGTVLAVKVFSLHLQGVFKSFDVECEVLRNLRHRNLTKVIGSCSIEDFKALVLKYMPRGSLEKWLYSHNYCLDLMQRLNIMIDVASGLEYLHHGYSSPIVHCDLKPSNVLLDEDMIAHVSDFGIAKLLGEGESISHTETLATLGYMAPEYGLEGLVSTRCDVYSYGIMLIEIFTRKRPSDDMFGQNFSLRIWVERSLPNQVIDANLMHPEEEHFDKKYGLEALVSTRCDVYSYGIMLIKTFIRKRPSDDMFGQNFSLRIWVERSLPNQVIDANLMHPEEEHFDKSMQCVSSILELALKCSTECPRDRINIKEALVELQKIKRQFLM